MWNVVRPLTAVSLVLIPWFCFSLMWLITPDGYYSKIFSEPEGIAVIATSMATSIAAFFLMHRSKSIFVWCTTFFFLVLPQIFIAILGSSVVPIVKAIGPILEGLR